MRDVIHFYQIMFNIEKAHFIVDEMVLNGHIVDSNKKNVLETVRLMDRKLTSWYASATNFL